MPEDFGAQLVCVLLFSMGGGFAYLGWEMTKAPYWAVKVLGSLWMAAGGLGMIVGIVRLVTW